jgi:hypothetical protein
MRLNAKYAGICSATGRPFNAGDLIDYNKAKKRAVLMAENKAIAVTLFDGDKASTFYRNARGRCIDAPCCGCCTI